jgi:hypothetical protein
LGATVIGDPADEIARRDEVLELLYWMEGEGFTGTATITAMTRFLGHDVAVVERTLSALVGAGQVSRDERSGEYCLTAEGRGEAARRFAEEFAPMLNQGHGECNDPGCDCHADPKSAAECHGGRHRS